ncbi:MAG: hypothetical protein ACI9QN_002281, partial [Arcticibacterium sp.]
GLSDSELPFYDFSFLSEILTLGCPAGLAFIFSLKNEPKKPHPRNSHIQNFLLF